MKKKRNAVILWKKRNNYGKNVMVATSVIGLSDPRSINPSIYRDSPQAYVWTFENCIDDILQGSDAQPPLGSWGRAASQ